MTNDEIETISREARTAAQSHRSGWPITNPYVYGTDQHKVWQERFQLSLKAAK